MAPAQWGPANRAGSAFDSLFDLAPERVCLDTRRFSRAGGLLPRLFTIAGPRGALRRLFLWHFPLRRFSRRPRPLTNRFPALRSPDFPLPLGSDRSRARRFVGNSQRSNAAPQARYRMRPHIVHATIDCGLPARPFFAFASASCPTDGGCTRWQPSHTPSCVSADTTGHLLVLSRS